MRSDSARTSSSTDIVASTNRSRIGDRQGRDQRPQPWFRRRRAARPSGGDAVRRAEVSHVCLNDDVVEGLRLLDTPAFSVQYHPEAAAGPHDSGYLFDRFVDLMEGRN